MFTINKCLGYHLDSDYNNVYISRLGGVVFTFVADRYVVRAVF